MSERITSAIRMFFVFLWDHLFVIATGLAAFTHSTWTLATAFGRTEPLPQFSHAWWSWVGPAALLAFAFDAGQIKIAVNLRNGKRTVPMYVAFAVLATSTYFLQWWYLAHHLPLLDLADGLRPEWRQFAGLLSDAILWIAPGLLPIATTLYTWSDAAPKRTGVRSPAKSATQPAKLSALVPVAELTSDVRIEMPEKPQKIIVECPDCDWRKECNTPRSATNSLIAHRRHRHNTEIALSENGHDQVT